jgi:hypothetical protein
MAMLINLEYDPNALAAPQSFRDGVQAAADILEAAIYDPITVNIAVGYGEYDYGGPEYTPLSNFSLGGVNSGIDVSYPELRAALAADKTSAAEAEAVASLPATPTLAGQSDFYITTAEAKALSVLPATDPAIDGYVGFPPSFTGDDLIDAGIVEMLHAMGLLNGGFVLSLFQYSSPGTHVILSATSTTPAYFSINGGNPDLANYDVSFDSTLFENLSSDPLSAPDTGSTVLTPLDLDEISSIGFDVSGPTALPTPSITPIPTAANVPAAVNVHNVSVFENTAIPALSLITSVTAPSGDSITSYGFYDQGGGSGGYFAIDGVVEPDDQWFYALNTQLTALQYVGGPALGRQVLEISAFDYTAGEDGPVSELTATTFVDDMILRQGVTGDYEIYDIANNQILGAYALGQVGTEWGFAGLGDFNGADTTDMILRDGITGAFEVYDISNNSITAAAALGQVGLEWQVAGFGSFNGPGGGTGMMIRDMDSGAFVLYDIVDDAITSASVFGQVGLEWQVAGFGDFSSNPNQTDMLLRDTQTGTFEVYDIDDSQLGTVSTLGQVGLEWQVAGFGDFSSNPNETDMLLRNVSTGEFVLYDVQHNQVTSANAIGQVGLEWQVAGFGSLNGAGSSDMVLRDTQTGAFEVYDIAHNQLTGAASLGQVGLEWQVGGFAPDPLTILAA